MVARVPSTRLTRASDIGTSRTAQSAVSGVGDLGRSALAQTNFGAVVSGVGEQLADVGTANQVRDNSRELKARVLRFKQDLFNRTYGNQELSIDGYRQTKGQITLDGAKQFREDIDKVRQTNSAEIADPDVQDLFNLETENLQIAAFTRHSGYIETQRKTAQDATDAATLQQVSNEIISDPTDPSNISRRIQIVDLTLEIADRAGITDANVRSQLVLSNLTSAHKGAIQRMLDEGDSVNAGIYFNQFSGEIIPREHGGIKKQINAGVVLTAAQAQFDLITGSGLDIKPADLLKAANDTKNPQVREKVVSMVRQHNADVVRQANAVDKGNRKSAIAKANVGNTEFTVAEEDAISGRPGMKKQLEKIAETVHQGRPSVSNRDTRGKSFKLYRENKSKFAEIDFDAPPYIDTLSVKDRDKLQTLQLGLDKAAVKADAAEQKAGERAARLSTALRATRQIIKGLDLSDEQEGDLSTALTDEIERRTAKGEVLQDSDYQAIVRGLAIQGEETDSGFFDDKNIRLFEAIANGTEFDIEDFKEESEALVKDIATKAGLGEQDTAIIVEDLVKARVIPTPSTVRRRFDAIIKARENALKKKPVTKETPAVNEQLQIQSDEGGNRVKSYIDSEGFLTGGAGHLLTKAEQKAYPEGTEIPQRIRDAWFELDMRTAVKDAASLVPTGAPEEVQSILVNMAFNMGKPRLARFKKMFAAIKVKDYNKAADEMKNSKWFRQVGNRSKRLVARMRKIK